MATVADRRASFVCSIAIARHGKVLHTVRGSVEGQLLYTAAGGNGFGYDPLFFFPPFGCSFGELDDKRKFSVSHRGNALKKTFSWLSGYDQQP
jgi:XTP/dITP diphosphohydrolase